MGGGEEEGLVKVSIRSRQGLDKVSIRVEAKQAFLPYVLVEG